MSFDVEIVATLVDNVSGAAKKIAESLGNIASTAANASVALGGTMLGEALAGLAVTGIKPAMQLEDAMTRVGISANLTSDNVAKLTDKLERVASRVPVTVTQLAAIADAGGRIAQKLPQGERVAFLEQYSEALGKFITLTRASPAAAGQLAAKLMTAFPESAAGMAGLNKMLSQVRALYEASGAPVENIVGSMLQMQGLAGRLGIKPEDTAAMNAFMTSLGLAGGAGVRGSLSMLLSAMFRDAEGKLSKKQRGPFLEAIKLLGVSSAQELADGFKQSVPDTLAKMGLALQAYSDKDREKIFHALFPNMQDFRAMFPTLAHPEQLLDFMAMYRDAISRYGEDFGKINDNMDSKVKESWERIDRLRRDLGGAKGIGGFGTDMFTGLSYVAGWIDDLIRAVPGLQMVAGYLATIATTLAVLKLGGGAVGGLAGMLGLTKIAGGLSLLAGAAPEIALIAGTLFIIWYYWGKLAALAKIVLNLEIPGIGSIMANLERIWQLKEKIMHPFGGEGEHAVGLERHQKEMDEKAKAAGEPTSEENFWTRLHKWWDNLDKEQYGPPPPPLPQAPIRKPYERQGVPGETEYYGALRTDKTRWQAPPTQVFQAPPVVTIPPASVTVPIELTGKSTSGFFTVSPTAAFTALIQAAQAAASRPGIPATGGPAVVKSPSDAGANNGVHSDGLPF